MSNNCNLELDN